MAATGAYHQRLSVPISKLSLLFDCIDNERQNKRVER